MVDFDETLNGSMRKNQTIFKAQNFNFILVLYHTIMFIIKMIVFVQYRIYL